jgi:hypothetical protein
MNRRFHRWLDDHEIVKFLLVVTFFAAPSLLLCLVGFIRFAESPYTGGWPFIGAGVGWLALWAISRFHYLYHLYFGGE